MASRILRGARPWSHCLCRCRESRSTWTNFGQCAIRYSWDKVIAGCFGVQWRWPILNRGWSWSSGGTERRSLTAARKSPFGHRTCVLVLVLQTRRSTCEVKADGGKNPNEQAFGWGSPFSSEIGDPEPQRKLRR